MLSYSAHTLTTDLLPLHASLQANTVVQGRHAALSAKASSSMVCEWTHPTKLACAAGRNLVQCQLLGLGKPARVVLLHSRPEGDQFVGLARPSQVCAAGQHLPCML